MPFGIGILIGIIIYLIRRRRHKRHGGDNASSMWVFCLLSWTVGLLILVLVIGGTYVLAWAVPFALAILLPSIISLGFVRLGYVKWSYYLGRISFFYFMVNPVGGGLLRGFQASLRVQDDEKRKRGLRWLKKVYLGRKMPLYSGDMVMFIIIDAHLSRPGDDAFLQRRLRLLEGIPSRSVPSGVAELGLRFALASVLDSASWSEVVGVAERWEKIGKNRLSRYLLAFNRVHYLKSGFIGWFKLWYASLFMRRSSVLRQWTGIQLAQLRSEGVATSAVKDNGLMQLWQSSDGGDSLISEERAAYWRQRAGVIGVWQFDEVWLRLTGSVSSYCAAGDGADMSEDEYLATEDILSAISYMEQGVLKKIQPNISGPGVEHSVDWFNLWEQMEALQHNQQAQQAAFSDCYHTIAIWMANLWDDRDEHRLAYLMAVKCYPLVDAFGGEELKELLYFVLGRNYKA